MANFAVIENDIVVNVIVAESIEDAITATNLICVEYTDELPAGIGWIYNGSTFEQPV